MSGRGEERFELLIDAGGHWLAAGIYPTYGAAFVAGDLTGARFSIKRVQMKEIA